MNHKIKSLEKKLNEFCELIDIDKQFTIKKKIDELLKNEHQLNDKKDFQIKSLIQSYDIRDNENY